MIVKATVADDEILTEIAIQSKAYWGYSQEHLEKWREDLTVSQARFNQWDVYKFISEETIVGFYCLSFDVEKSTACIEFLFVLPESIGKAIGSQLLHHAFQNAKKRDVKTIHVLSDPNAANFYAKYGFQEIAKEESSIPGRFLPIMEKKLI
jgi:N-acetylglutamate synthase-like GNAT family acetyltransferase